MLGTGEVFKFPQDVAASVLLEGITIYMRRQHNSRPLKICMVLHPSDQPPKQVKKDHRELVEVNVADLKELSCHKVFFVNLIPWKEKDDEAVQVLLCGVLGVLSSCHKQGFDSVAFPILGTGEVFKFPQHVAASVLLEGITIYKSRQHNSRPLKICMVLHPSDQPTKQQVVAHSNTAHSDRWADTHTGHQHLPASPDESKQSKSYCPLM
ncbi:hypothetical protein CRUP_016056 [Coryphaenoides rupestris]|nr:hypothetical protein CRUP_016056 [Coryphaenoides rupestris]